MKAFLLIFILLNIFTFLIFGYDKLLAKTNRSRISEKTLFIMAILGGSVGAVFGQKLFHHKSRKYRKVFWLILSVQFLTYEVLWFYGSNFGEMLKNIFS